MDETGERVDQKGKREGSNREMNREETGQMRRRKSRPFSPSSIHNK